MIAYESHTGLWAEIECRDVDAATAAESHPRSGVACEMGLASAGLGENIILFAYNECKLN